jgi:glycosyltransferase involved in cell wall biosynthesis
LIERTQSAPRLLFVPVSGAYGMGEYARSLAIAQGAQARWPDAAVHFLLSEQAPYAASTPFAHTLLPSSPTFHSGAVIECLRRQRPDAVIFDNAGRTAQLRAAHAQGAAVIYISSRRRQRAKAFRWRWMGLIDEHWIAYPEFIAGSLRPLEKLKLAIRGRPRLRYLDVILSPGAAAADVPGAPGTGDFALVVPGGGTGHPGAADVVGQFFAAAARLASDGVRTVFVGPGAGAAAAPNLRVLASLPQAELAALLRAAALVVVNGGSTLLQAIACGRACVAIPIAKDQRERIRRCVAAGVAVGAVPAAAAIAQAAIGLWRDAPARTELARRAAELRLSDGIKIALQGLATSLHKP